MSFKDIFLGAYLDKRGAGEYGSPEMEKIGVKGQNVEDIKTSSDAFTICTLRWLCSLSLLAKLQNKLGKRWVTVVKVDKILKRKISLNIFS